MLRDSCPHCDIPLLFDKKKQRTFCAGCGREVRYASEEAEVEQVEQEYATRQQTQHVSSQVEGILLGKLDYLAQLLASTTDLDQLEQLLTAMDHLLGVVGHVRQLNA